MAGCRNSKPAPVRRLGMTRALVSSSDDISPRASCSTSSGTRSQGKSGRRRAWFSAATSSLLVTALGAVRLNAPLAVLASSRNRMAAISSVSEIQLMTCVPVPKRGSAPKRAGVSSRASTPPPLPRTRPLRRCATRMPACAAGAAAASQSETTRDKNPCPAGESSVTSRPPVSPYQPIAEAVSRTLGGAACAASTVASARVARTRLARISALYDRVHRWSPTPAPARWTQASTPLSAGSPASAARGSQRISSVACGGRLTRRTT
jgi:hypothetical protein